MLFWTFFIAQLGILPLPLNVVAANAESRPCQVLFKQVLVEADREFIPQVAWNRQPPVLTEEPKSAFSAYLSVSNEREHYFFENVIQKNSHHGGYLGVGAEQNYTMMAMADASEAWLYDGNPRVLQGHMLYRAAFLESKNPEDFIQFFSPENLNQSKAIIRHYYPENAALVKIFEVSSSPPVALQGWRPLSQILREISAFKTNGKNRTFLGDAQFFSRVKDLYRKDKIHLSLGNHSSVPVFEHVAFVLKEHQLSLDVFYSSNSFWSRWTDYASPSLCKNLLSLSDSSPNGIFLSTAPQTYVELGVAQKDYQILGQGGQNGLMWQFSAMHLGALIHAACGGGAK